MAFPVILYDNILRNAGATVSASSSDSGFAVADLADLRAWKIWRSGVTTSPITIDIDLGASGADAADTLGIVNTNMKAIGGTIEVLADSFTPPTTSRLAAATPASDDVDLRTFTSPGNLRYWRIRLAHAAPPFSAQPFIGELFLGMRTTWPEYLDPGIDPFFRDTEAEAAHSAGGHFLGALMRGQTHRGELATSATGMARSFFTSDFNAFIDNHFNRFRPFIFQVDGDDNDFKRPYYLVKSPDGRTTRSAVGSMWNRLIPRLPVVEAWMEAA